MSEELIEVFFLFYVCFDSDHVYDFDAWLDGAYGYDASGCDKSRDMWEFSCKGRDKK